MTATSGEGEPGLVERVLEKVVSAGAARWYRGTDENQKFAVGVITAAAVLGPLGQGLLAALKALYGGGLPNWEQLKAVLWLTVITLPVFLAAAAGAFFIGKLATPVVLGLAVIAAVLGVAGMAEIGVPDNLGDFYCYNDGTVLERECRAFDENGFTTDSMAANSSPERLWIAFQHTADARGGLMALCGLAAGGAFGYLVRRQAE